MEKTDISLKAKYKGALLERIKEKGPLIPLIFLIIGSSFALIDYLVLDIFSKSWPFRLLVIVPLVVALWANLLSTSPSKLLLLLQNSWLLGGNLMMAGLCFLVFTEYQFDLPLKYGTILGYSVAIFISILVADEIYIIYIVLCPLVIVSAALAILLTVKEVVLISNLYVVAGVSLFILINKHKKDFQSFKDKLLIDNLNKQLADFAHIASHDLRSPLGTISTHLDLAERRLMQDRREEAIRIFPTIKGSVRQMDKLLQGIMSYSQEANEEHKFEEVNLSELFEKVKISLEEICLEVDAKIDAKLEGYAVHGIETRIYQIFYNLILNAIKYRHPDRSPSILVDAFFEKDQLLIGVHDNGLGIPTFFHSRIFKPFERYHTQFPGSGLGLSMVEKHMQAHQGKVSLDSKEDIGSSFFLHFPNSLVIKLNNN